MMGAHGENVSGCRPCPPTLLQLQHAAPHYQPTSICWLQAMPGGLCGKDAPKGLCIYLTGNQQSNAHRTETPTRSIAMPSRALNECSCAICRGCTR